MENNDSTSSFLSRGSEPLVDEESVDEDTLRSYTTSEEEEYVESLSNRETGFGFKKDESLVFGDEVKRARLEAIDWIIRSGTAFGFRKQTAYLSITYLDRYLSKNPIDNNDQLWVIRLLSVASLRIAAKMEESKIPSASEFRSKEGYFEGKVIEKMEFLLLNTLEWRVSSITPFAFLHYLITKLCQESPPRNILSRITELIMSAIKEINLVEHRPSAVAAGATLVALGQKLTKAELELKMNSISRCKNLTIGLRINLEPPDLSSPPTGSRPNDGLETSSVTDELHSGSKRLASTTSSDQNYGEKRLR
ncbi:Cyclin [Parasponia andersonii]|uniref:B-like cyclin n=1 Tax=Parasponia andersonii TaxID=3476 RepID=A0A2P5DI41_PARAD|nr:Cyclin [Parasponia andersonii]